MPRDYDPPSPAFYGRDTPPPVYNRDYCKVDVPPPCYRNDIPDYYPQQHDDPRRRPKEIETPCYQINPRSRSPCIEDRGCQTYPTQDVGNRSYAFPSRLQDGHIPAHDRYTLPPRSRQLVAPLEKGKKPWYYKMFKPNNKIKLKRWYPESSEQTDVTPRVIENMPSPPQRGIMRDDNHNYEFANPPTYSNRAQPRSPEDYRSNCDLHVDNQPTEIKRLRFNESSLRSPSPDNTYTVDSDSVDYQKAQKPEIVRHIRKGTPPPKKVGWYRNACTSESDVNTATPQPYDKPWHMNYQQELDTETESVTTVCQAFRPNTDSCALTKSKVVPRKTAATKWIANEYYRPDINGQRYGIEPDSSSSPTHTVDQPNALIRNQATASPKRSDPEPVAPKRYDMGKSWYNTMFEFPSTMLPPSSFFPEEARTNRCPVSREKVWDQHGYPPAGPKPHLVRKYSRQDTACRRPPYHHVSPAVTNEPLEHLPWKPSPNNTPKHVYTKTAEKLNHQKHVPERFRTYDSCKGPTHPNIPNPNILAENMPFTDYTRTIPTPPPLHAFLKDPVSRHVCPHDTYAGIDRYPNKDQEPVRKRSSLKQCPHAQKGRRNISQRAMVSERYRPGCNNSESGPDSVSKRCDRRCPSAPKQCNFQNSEDRRSTRSTNKLYPNINGHFISGVDACSPDPGRRILTKNYNASQSTRGRQW